MKLEPGKYYKTRENKKIYIIGINPFEVEDNVVGSFDTGLVCSWKPNGCFLETIIDSNDIISEWHEPKKVKVDFWVNVYDEGADVSFHPDKRDADLYNVRYRAERIACLRIEQEIEEGTGL